MIQYPVTQMILYVPNHPDQERDSTLEVSSELSLLQASPVTR